MAPHHDPGAPGTSDDATTTGAGAHTAATSPADATTTGAGADTAATSPADDPAPSGPLAGILVADLSRVLAGPYCTMLLADLGAEVVKVEGPGGDDTRRWTPPTYDGDATYYLSINRNKRSIALDFGDAEDLALAHELAARADVVIENFKPGGLRRFGLDYDAVRAMNDAVVYCSISGFGDAEGSGLAGYDLIVQAVSGLMSVTGEPEGEGTKAGVAVVDVITGLHSAVAILAALRHRSATGEGQHLKANLLSSALSGLVNHTAAYLLTGESPTRMGNQHPSLYPYEPFPTKEGRLVVAAGNDTQFRVLCNALGVPQLPDDPRFASVGERTSNRDELRPLLYEAFAARTSQEWFDILSVLGIPCGPINTIGEGVQLADRLGLDPVTQVADDVRSMPMLRHPVSFSATPPRYVLPPPALDQHGDEIRRWLAADGT